MRCKRCGWMNPASAETCEKCSNPLTFSTYAPPAPETNNQEDPDVKKTMVVHRGEPAEASQNVKHHCPNCGYPVWSNMSICPQCKYPLEQLEEPDTDIPPQGDPLPQPSGETDNPEKKTINPYLSRPAVEKPIPGPKITLSSKSTADTGKQPENRVLHGTEIRLNSAGEVTTDANETQAVITMEDGQWYIEDKGEVKNTLVLATRKIPIQTGDIFIINEHQCLIVDTDSDNKAENN